MIASLQGTVLQTTAQTIILQTPAISFEIQTPHAHQHNIQNVVHLFIYMHWHQENGPQLFGFNTQQDKEIFLLLVSCQGIGPKMALNILEQLQPQELLQGIVTENIQLLSSVNGIGTKKAEQICVQLKYKAQDFLKTNPDFSTTQSSTILELQQILQSLNYSSGEIKQTMNYLKNEKHKTENLDFLLKKALTFLAQK